MYLELTGRRTFIATGGKTFDPGLPAVVFLHGSALDHRCWALQTRWFAFHGYSVIAPDFPGHSLSQGDPLASIEAMSDWLWALLDTLSVTACSLVGHSQGGLIALEAAARRPEQVRSLSLIATAAAIAVNPQLLATARENRAAAVDAMLQWGFGTRYQFGLSQVPGQAPIGIGHRIMCQNPLAMDLQACSDYTNGATAAGSVSCPAQLILARQDRMTPAVQGLKLADHLQDLQSQCVLEGVGHMLPMEAPDQCLSALQPFITRRD